MSHDLFHWLDGVAQSEENRDELPTGLKEEQQSNPIFQDLHHQQGKVELSHRRSIQM